MAVGPIYNILFIDVATAVIGISILTLIKIPKHQPAARTAPASVLAEMKEGLEFTCGHKFLRRMLATYGAYIFLCVPSGFLTALMIQRTFGSNILNDQRDRGLCRGFSWRAPARRDRRF